MIKFKNLYKTFDDHNTGLKDINLEIKKGQFLTIIGPSGAGKSTLLNIIIGEKDYDQGSLLFEGQEIKEMNNQEMARLRREVGVVHQDYKLLKNKTVKENVAYVLEVIGVDEERINSDTQKALRLVGLEDRTNYYPDQLSGGEKQRLAIARALIHQPKVIFADEPSGNLDPQNTRNIIQILNKIHDLGTTIVVFTHDKDVIKQTPGRIIVIRDGRIVQDDHKDFVF